jgi:ABC-type multidrug transport system ATPase subunit
MVHPVSLSGEYMSLYVENLTIKVGSRLIIKNFSFTVDRGHTLSLIGHSGSGKKTLIKAILGLTKYFTISGNVYFEDQLIQQNNRHIIPLNARKFGYISQEFSLWPHLNVSDTIRLAAKFSYHPKHHINEWTKELIHFCGLDGMHHSRPSTLSGGEKQRLAFARALAGKPRFLVLDEPFSALDVIAKDKLITLIKGFHTLYSLTILFISHDVAEACALGQKIMIIERGEKIWLDDREYLAHANFTNHWNPMTSALIKNDFM